MVSLDLVNESILELEQKDTSFANCERLAWLYIVKDHLQGYIEPKESKTTVKGNSEFLQAVNNKNPELIWPVLDELVEVVKITQPRVYDKLIKSIKEL